MSIHTCAECEYYEPKNGKGSCKAEPPKRSVTSSAGHINVVLDGWPEVDGEGMACSAFELKR